MASYKQACMHCGSLINSDSRFCPKCGSRSPFAIHCPSCSYEISGSDLICAGCGRSLSVECPICGKKTFVADQCEFCQGSLLVPCPNKRCGEMVFFENTHCTYCGKKIVPLRR